MKIYLSILFGIIAGIAAMSDHKHNILIALMIVVVGIIISNGSAFGEVNK